MRTHVILSSRFQRQRIGFELDACDYQEAWCIYTRRRVLTRDHQVADVAELADALDSKSGIRKDVWVRPPPSAPSRGIVKNLATGII